MAKVFREIRIDANSPYCEGRIDRLIQDLVGGGSRSMVAALFEQDCVWLNDENDLEGWRLLHDGDRVRLKYEDSHRYAPRPRPRMHDGFAVIYEDRDCIVVDKSAGLLTIPTRKNERNSLAERLEQYLRHRHRGNEIHVVHRLDRDVSGLLVFAKSEDIAGALRDQFAYRKPERRYVAIVAGRVSNRKGMFRSHLATDEDLNRYSTEDKEVGQLAITRYRVLEYLTGTTLVEAQLETGRRNQIRVHFAENGNPILGDPRYSPDTARHANWPYRRVALHARTLAFTQPITGARLRLRSQFPPEMVRFLSHPASKSEIRH